MKKVAELAGVSLGTMSKYLNVPDRVAPQTQARIRAAVAELGYTRNETARQLKTGKSRILACVALELNNPFFGAIAEVMERRANELGLFLTIVCTSGDAEREAEYVRLLVQQRVHGVILASGLTPERELNLLYESGIPTVLLDAFGESDQFPSCSVNDYAGADQAVRHLIEQGRTRIAFIGGEERTHQVSERLRGAQNAVAATPGVSLEVIPTVDRSVVAGLSVGDQLLLRRPSDRPDGILAVNDSLAIGIMEALTIPGGARVPDDISIVGYDDIDFAAAATVPLSTVRRPHTIFGRTALGLIADQAEAAERLPVRHIVIQPELIVRESSRPSGTGLAA